MTEVGLRESCGGLGGCELGRCRVDALLGLAQPPIRRLEVRCRVTDGLLGPSEDPSCTFRPVHHRRPQLHRTSGLCQPHLADLQLRPGSDDRGLDPPCGLQFGAEVNQGRFGLSQRCGEFRQFGTYDLELR